MAQAVTVTYYALDTSNKDGKTGDAANHTLRGVRDGTQFVPSNAPAEVDAVNNPGLYKLTLTATENDGLMMTLHGKSATANIIIIPKDWCNVWEYDTRTITQTAATVISAVLGDNVTVYKDVHWEVTLTGLSSDMTDQTEVYLGIKNDIEDDDADAILLVSRTSGIEVLNGAATGFVAADATLTVESSTSVKLVVKARAAAEILPNTYAYGVKRISAADSEPYLGSEGGQWRVAYATVEEIT